jgi:hypothetical protein
MGTLRGQLRPLTVAEKEGIVVAYRDGVTLQKIAETFECSVTTVQRYVRESGATRRLVEHLPREDEKWCTKCQAYRPIDQFYPSCKARCRTHFKHTFTPQRKAYGKAYREARPKEISQRNRQYWLKSAHGITSEEYEELFQAQGGVCAICHLPETKRTKTGAIRSLHIDHDHKSNRRRQLLCARCNLALGFVLEDVEIAKSLVKYIERWT